MKRSFWIFLVGLLTCSPVPNTADPAPAILLLLPVTPPALVSTPQSTLPPQVVSDPLEEAILDQAALCPKASQGTIDRNFLRGLLRLEEAAQIPPRLRGMVLVAACQESGYDPQAEGDHRFSRDGKTPMAIGLYQQWPWWSTRGPKINRRDPTQATQAWLAHVTRQVPKMQRKCRFNPVRREDDLWRAAWITAVRAPAKQPRCYQSFSHWRTFKKWRTAWAQHLQPAVIAQGSIEAP